MGLEKLFQSRFVQYPNTQLLRLGEFGAGIGTGHQVISPAGDAPSYPGSQRLKLLFDLVSGATQGASQNDSLSGQRRRLRPGTFHLPVDTSRQQLCDHLSVMGLAKEGDDMLRHHRADIWYLL